MEIDIRKDIYQSVTHIRVADNCTSNYVANILERSESYLLVTDSAPRGDRSLAVKSEQHARDLIKGLERAIELGWFSE